MTRKENPYGVSVGQIWRAIDYRRQSRFVVKGLTKVEGKPYAFCGYISEATKKAPEKIVRISRINLLRFDQYVKVGDVH